MTFLRLFAIRADAALFANPAARLGWAVLGAALGLWQGPVAMIALTGALIAVSEILGHIARRPAAPRVARTGELSFAHARHA
ncbi:hypothetical protein L2U69_06270 [Zavarzinia compransoris]|uniref:hypothetical protein n=1 Tax=Zavarzinia marina TaxID=2911065 RepID=UPI001F342017|nr:hypothetical protein [Zavarzinia marina]MCF4165241.1 hypothetical protein [Zavarzinia marina]